MKTGGTDKQREAIYLIVASIPAGRVATYGQVAMLAGVPGSARWVGRVLAQLPEGSGLPWHRVLNARGEISLPPGSFAHARQRQQLECEGVAFQGRRVSLRSCQWRPETTGDPAW